MSQQSPLYIKVHENDNVAIVVNSGGVPEGTTFPCGLTTVMHVPQAHKVALKAFEKGDEVRRYNQIIGYAMQALPKGSWIDESRLEMPEPPSLDTMPLATEVPATLPPLEGYTFMGYRNTDGTVGTRNILALAPNVQCVAGLLLVAADKIRAELLPKYPNVDDVVALNHQYGCGVAIDAPDAVVPIRHLQNIIKNPNFGGEALIVGLGCEKLAADQMCPGLKAEDMISMQEYPGFEACLAALMEKAEERLVRLNKRVREVCPASALVMGVQCGGSDAFSGITANPSIGYASDMLVRCGATVMFSEVTEVRDAVQMMTVRARNKEVAGRIIEEMHWYDNYLARGGVNRSSNTAPGNKKGGLSNIVEKALGSIAKSGSSAIDHVLSPGELVDGRKGLIYANASASDFVCGTSQASSGITLQVFSSGRGTCYALRMLPVIKIASRTDLAEHWHDLVDINAGTIATGDATIKQVGEQLFKLILETASGSYIPWSDRWGIYNDLCVFNPAPIT